MSTKKDSNKTVENQANAAQAETQTLSNSQRRDAAEKRREAKIQRASENGSFVLQLHSGDEMYSLVTIIPQLDRGISLLQQRTRRFGPIEKQAVNERIIKLVDDAVALTKDICEITGVRFWLPRPLLDDKKSNENND